MIPAVSYLRMSKESQDASIPAQRTAIAALAKAGGYRIIREYVDSGISGDATEKRMAFQKMLADVTRGDFKVILCWDQDRFGRFDSLEAGFWILPLRSAGVQLVTVAQGKIDWNDFSGRIIYTIQQEGKHQFLRDLSRNSNRGKMEAAKTGRWMGGQAPYGYQIGSNGRLLPHPEHAHVVSQIFAWYAEGKSMRHVCMALADLGLASPRGGNWSPNTISKIISNRLYLGHTQYNKRSRGKYTRIVNGEIVAKSGAIPSWNDQSLWMVIENTHAPLTDPKTFAAAQQYLSSNRRLSGPQSHDRLLFRTMLRCGWCGAAMHGFYNPVMKDACYVCSAHRFSGFCKRNVAYQKPLLQMVRDELDAEFLSDSKISQARQAVTDSLAKHSHEILSEKDLRSQRDAVRLKLAAAGSRLLKVPDDMISVVANQIRQLRDEDNELTKKISLASRPQPDVAAQMHAILDESLSSYRHVRLGIDSGDPAALIAAIKSAFDRIVIWSEKSTDVFQDNGRRHPNGKWFLTKVEMHAKSPSAVIR